MPITVNISLSTGGRFKPLASRSLDEAHITIGRDKECSLTLEDTQKHVSRVHAEVDDKGGRYWLTVVSKVNPVIVNGKRYMFGNRVELADGDVLAVGLYKLEIQILPVAVEPEPPTPAAAEPAAGRPEPPPAAPARTRTPPPADFADDMTYIPPAANKPAPAPEPPAALRRAFPDDLSADMTYVPPAAPRAVLPAEEVDEEATYVPPSKAAPRPAPATEPPPSAGTPAPDEEITFVRPAAEPAEPAPNASPSASAPVPDEEAFSDEVTYIRRPTPRPPEVQVTPPAETAGSEMDLELDFDLSDGADSSEDETQYRPAAAAPGADAMLEEEDTLLRPVVTGSAPAAVHPNAAALGAHGGQGGPEADRSLRAFLDGAGLAHLEVEDPEPFMRDSGMMVRTAIEGIMMLLLASTGVRKSFGAQAEEASPDNPLKGMTDPAKVIRFLFDPAQRSPDGPDPVQALGDACSDLRVHQVALIAAMQAAVLSALQAVDPKAVEQEQGSHIGGLNLTRKSKLWDLAVAQHEKLTLEVRENLSRVFGPEVLAAYLAEVRRVRGGR